MIGARPAQRKKERRLYWLGEEGDILDPWGQPSSLIYHARGKERVTEKERKPQRR